MDISSYELGFISILTEIITIEVDSNWKSVASYNLLSIDNERDDGKGFEITCHLGPWSLGLRKK